MHEWQNKINWAWYRSIIDAYRTFRISRERFMVDWKNVQETMESLNKGGCS
jgi:hypothetical protein